MARGMHSASRWHLDLLIFSFIQPGERLRVWEGAVKRGRLGVLDEECEGQKGRDWIGLQHHKHFSSNMNEGRPPQPVHNYCFKNKNPLSSQMPSIHSSGLFIQKSGKSFSIGCLCKELQRQISSKYTFCSPQIKSAALGHIINGQMYVCLSFFP